MEEFQNLRKHPFPFVIGCIDGTHIPIIAPKKEGTSYYNRKGFCSIILQGVCDCKGKFIDAFFGFPGRCHEAWVWKYSSLKESLEKRKIIMPEGAVILGDCAYPLLEYLIVP